jgi:tRNA threonylcarbamoyladenosine biosynthesis protein TsaB
MKLLATDTALGACSALVMDNGTILAQHFEIMERGHAEAVAPMVETAMGVAGIGFSALDRLAVTTGPGTFTGQRVGLAFMRGLRLALNIPLIGVTTLEAMAAAASAATGQRKAAAIHDARREEAYLALRGDGEMTLDPTVMTFAAAIECIRAFGPCALAGTGAIAASKALGVDFPLSGIRQPDAFWVAELARNRPAPDRVPGPLYLRPPDAKLPAPA